MESTEFGKFIVEYINKHNITLNKFAQQMGTSHTTIDRWLAGKTEPSLKQLSKLASATGTDVCYLVYMLYPEARPKRSPEVVRLADDIAGLPADMQKIIQSLLIGFIVQQRSNNPNEG